MKYQVLLLGVLLSANAMAAPPGRTVSGILTDADVEVTIQTMAPPAPDREPPPPPAPQPPPPPPPPPKPQPPRPLPPHWCDPPVIDHISDWHQREQRREQCHRERRRPDPRP